MNKMVKAGFSLAIGAAVIFVNSCAKENHVCLRPVDYKSYASCKGNINSCNSNICKGRRCKN